MNETVNSTAEEVSEQPPEHIPSYTVDALLEKLGVTANVQIWKSIDTIIYVQGVVSKIKPYGRVVYFDLLGGNTKLSIKCPLDLRPQEGDNIVVEGLPMLRPSRFNTGLDVIIEGKPVLNVEPAALEIDEPMINLQKGVSLRLHDYLAQHWVNDFCITGTETALRDAMSQIQPDIRDLIQTKIIRVSEKTAMLSDLKDAIEDFHAFAIVRGGDDASLSLWNDPQVIKELLFLERPFYIALGHTHFISLTTQYADESFHTPTDLGIAINTITERLLNEKKLFSECEVLKRHQAEMNKEYAVVKEKERSQYEKIEGLKQKNDWFYQQNIEYKKQNNRLLIAVAILGSIIALSIIF